MYIMSKNMKKIKKITSKALHTVNSGANNLATGVSKAMIGTGMVVGQTLGAVIGGVTHGYTYGHASGFIHAVSRW